MTMRATLSEKLSPGLSGSMEEQVAPTVLRRFEVWFDAAVGAGTNQGTISGVTATLATGVTDEGAYWDCSGGAAEGIEVDNYTGELTCGGTTQIGTSGNEIIRGFMVCDMGAITPGSTNRRIWSNKVANTDAAVGLYVTGSANDTLIPSLVIGDGTDSSTATHATNIESAGRVMVYWDTFFFLADIIRINVITSSGIGTAVTSNIDADNINDFEIPGQGMVFGAGNDADPPNAANGPDGAATWHIYAIGFDRSQNRTWSADAAFQVADYYGVI